MRVPTRLQHPSCIHPTGCRGEQFPSNERSVAVRLEDAPRNRGASQKGASPPISRILSWTAIYLGPTLLPASRGLHVTGGPPCPCSTLLRMGFAKPLRFPGTLVVSYTTVSPLPVPPGCEIPEGHRRSALCCTFRRVAPPGSYPASCPVESGLSSARGPRPSGELARPRSFHPTRATCREEMPSGCDDDLMHRIGGFGIPGWSRDFIGVREPPTKGAPPGSTEERPLPSTRYSVPGTS